MSNKNNQHQQENVRKETRAAEEPCPRCVETAIIKDWTGAPCYEGCGSEITQSNRNLSYREFITQLSGLISHLDTEHSMKLQDGQRRFSLLPEDHPTIAKRYNSRIHITHKNITHGYI